MALPRTPEEYQRYLSERLNWFEKLRAGATSLDERIDVTNLLLMEMLKGISVLGAPGVPAPPTFPPTAPYSIRYFALDTARAAPGEKVDVPGNTIVAFTNGTLEGVFIRIDEQGNDAIPLNEFNPVYYPLGFSKFFLETPAQVGDYLRLLIGQQVAISAGVPDMAIHGLYLQPEWAAKEGMDKNFEALGSNQPFAGSATLYYTVPAGKILYICGLTFQVTAVAAANGDLNQMGMAQLINTTAGEIPIMIGGNGGGGVATPKPIAIPATQEMGLEVFNLANHTCNIGATCWGYEI